MRFPACTHQCPCQKTGFFLVLPGHFYPLPLCPFAELAPGARQRTGATAKSRSGSPGFPRPQLLPCEPWGAAPRAHAPECQTREASALLGRDGKSLASGIQGRGGKRMKNKLRRALPGADSPPAPGTAWRWTVPGGHSACTQASTLPLLAARPGPPCRPRAAVAEGTGPPPPPAFARPQPPRQQCSASPSHL